MLLRPYYAYDQNRRAWYYSDTNNHSQAVCCYFNPDENTWQKEQTCLNFMDAFSKNTFNALNAETGGVLYLDLYDPLSPILYLRGFSYPLSFNAGATNPTHNSNTELFDPDGFKQGLNIKEVLTNLGQIGTINYKNKETGRIDTSYRFFGKTAGDNSYLRPYEIYIIYKKCGDTYKNSVPLITKQ